MKLSTIRKTALAFVLAVSATILTGCISVERQSTPSTSTTVTRSSTVTPSTTVERTTTTY